MPKHLYGLFLGTPYCARELARRCRYMRTALLTGEWAWYADNRRGARGVGYNWRRKPRDLGRPRYPGPM